MNLIGQDARLRRVEERALNPSLSHPRRDGAKMRTRRQARSVQGFKAYQLTNEQVRVTVVPELGGRLISLQDLRTGREWLWHPADGLKLFRNERGDNFENGSLVGMDDCLPTIAPCSWRKRDLPDHGEIWTAASKVDLHAWGEGLIRTTVSLNISPFDFERTIELCDNQIRLSYHLKNRAASEEHYLWAMHPLIELQSGDQLDLPASTRALLKGAAWLDSLTSSQANRECHKVFASKVRDGWAGVSNAKTGDRLRFDWDPAQNDTLGLWLTRGGWHGHHHFALEPCNGEPDALAAAAKAKRCGVLAPEGSVTWQVCIRVGN
jgi:hypothetical protein